MFNIFKKKQLMKEFELFKSVYSILITEDKTIYCLYGDDYKSAHYVNMKTGKVLKLKEKTDEDFYNIKDYGYIEGKKIVDVAEKHEIFDWITTPFVDMNELLYEMFVFIKKKKIEFFNTPEMKKLTNNFNDFHYIKDFIEELIDDAIENVYPSVWEWYDSDDEVESFNLPIGELEELQEFQKRYYLQDLDEAIVFSAIKKYIEV